MPTLERTPSVILSYKRSEGCASIPYAETDTYLFDLNTHMPLSKAQAGY